MSDILATTDYIKIINNLKSQVDSLQTEVNHWKIQYNYLKQQQDQFDTDTQDMLNQIAINTLEEEAGAL